MSNLIVHGLHQINVGQIERTLRFKLSTFLRWCKSGFYITSGCFNVNISYVQRFHFLCVWVDPPTNFEARFGDFEVRFADFDVLPVE